MVITAADLQPGDRITFNRNIPLTGHVTHVEPGPNVALWMADDTTRWLIPADTELFIERTAA